MLGSLMAMQVDMIFAAKEQMEAKQMQDAQAAFAKKLDVDKIEAQIAGLPTRCDDLNYDHEFFPGLYTRTIYMPAGLMLTSKIHNTEHPYVVTEGQCLVWTPDNKVEHILAPHRGRTTPGTKRIIFVLENCVWTTFHPISDEEQGDLEKIEKRIIEHRVNPLIPNYDPSCLKN